jgi:hypothetical protein
VQNGQLNWTLVGNTAGFGHGINDGRPFWIGEFTGGGTADVLFYYPGDDNWWLGSVHASVPENPECATHRADIAVARNEISLLQQQLRQLNPRDPADRFEIRQIRDHIRTLQERIRMYQSQMNGLGCPVRPLGALALDWTLAGNTAGFGHAINDGRPFWIGDFTGGDTADVLFYYPGDDNWWLGSVQNGQLNWTLVGNTAGFAGR